MTPVVLLLIIANVAVYLLQGTSDFFIIHLALWPLGEFPVAPGVSVGFEPWQLITCAFLHDQQSLAHIALNLFALYMFGRDVESVLGSRRFAWLYGASVLTGSLVQLLVVSARLEDGIGPTLGASGGVFGVLLAFGVIFPKRRVMLMIPPIPMPAWLLVTGYGLVELISGVFRTQSGVAHFAHLGGMLGAAVVLFMVSRSSRPPPPPMGR